MLKKIEQIVKKYPQRIAYKNGENYITYLELWKKSDYYADLLKREGINPIIIYGHKSINMIVTIISCIKSNRAYIPIELGTPIERIKEIMKQSNSSLVLSDYMLEEIESYKIEDLVKYSDGEIIINNNDTVYIIFTSGSTGKPKGVPISKNNLNNFINWISKDEVLSKYNSINVLNNASFSFDLSVVDIYYSLCNGHTIITYDYNIEEYEKVIETYKKENINLSVMTPTSLKLCLLEEDFNSNNIPSLDCIYLCGEQLEEGTVKKILNVFPNIKILNAYGPTEATSAVSMIRIEEKMLNNSYLPVGRIDKAAVEITIENEEIILKGESVFGGYISLESNNCYSDGDINCYKTGDIGYIKNNLLYCIGRKDSQIKYKGYRIELGEIEKCLKDIDGVKDAVVIAKYNDFGIVKVIKAFVISDINEEDIRTILKSKLPLYMIPKSIIKLDSFPINKNGKIDRKVLSEL